MKKFKQFKTREQHSTDSHVETLEYDYDKLWKIMVDIINNDSINPQIRLSVLNDETTDVTYEEILSSVESLLMDLYPNGAGELLDAEEIVQETLFKAKEQNLNLPDTLDI